MRLTKVHGVNVMLKNALELAGWKTYPSAKIGVVKDYKKILTTVVDDLPDMD